MTHTLAKITPHRLIIRVIAFLALILILSCSPILEDQSENLLGQWEYYESNNGYDAFQNDIEFTSRGALLIPESANPKMRTFEYSFLEGNRLRITVSGQSEIISYEISKNSLKLIFEDGYNLYRKKSTDAAKESTENQHEEQSLVEDLTENIFKSRQVITPKNADRLKELNHLGKGSVRDIQFSPNGAKIFVGTDFGIYIYDSSTLEEITSINYENSLDEFLVSPDSKFLVSRHSIEVQKEFVVYDVNSGKELWKTKKIYNNDQMAISPNSNLLATSGNYFYDRGSEHIIQIWDIFRRNELFTFDGQSGILQFSPDGKMLASGGYGGDISIWDLENRTLLQKFGEKTLSFFFSSDNTLLISTSDYDNYAGNDIITVWDLKSGKALYKLDGVYEYTLSTDGNFLLMSTRGQINDIIHIYDLQSGVELNKP